jgi:hypothetical protein
VISRKHATSSTIYLTLLRCGVGALFQKVPKLFEHTMYALQHIPKDQTQELCEAYTIRGGGGGERKNMHTHGDFAGTRACGSVVG